MALKNRIQWTHAFDFHLKGITFNSRKWPELTREELIFGVRRKTPLFLERYEYEGSPAYMVVLKNGSDIGVVPEEDVAKIEQYVTDNELYYELKIAEKYYIEDIDQHGLLIEFWIGRRPK